MTYKEKMLKINKLNNTCDAACRKIDADFEIRIDKISRAYERGNICLTEKYMLIQKETICAKIAIDAEYRYRFQLISAIAKEVDNE